MEIIISCYLFSSADYQVYIWRPAKHHERREHTFPSLCNSHKHCEGSLRYLPASFHGVNRKWNSTEDLRHYSATVRPTVLAKQQVNQVTKFRKLVGRRVNTPVMCLSFQGEKKLKGKIQPKISTSTFC